MCNYLFEPFIEVPKRSLKNKIILKISGYSIKFTDWLLSHIEKTRILVNLDGY